MFNLGTLILTSLAVLFLSTALAETVDLLPSYDNTIDTDDENFAELAVAEEQRKPFSDGNHRNQKINPDGEAKDSKKGSEMASKDDILSINKTLENIQKDTGIAMDEVKKMRDRLNRLEKSMSTSSECPENVPLRFHSSFYGRNVVLSSDFRTATKPYPLEDGEFFGSVVSQRPLYDEEMFKIRIEETVDKMMDWGIAIGVIRYPGPEIKTSDAIHSAIEGTWAIYSDHYSSPRTSHRYIDGYLMTYNGYPLQTNNLSVGTVIGVSRRHNGDIHFHLDRVDKGVAFKNIPKCVYAFVDIINYVSKIRVVN